MAMVRGMTSPGGKAATGGSPESRHAAAPAGQNGGQRLSWAALMVGLLLTVLTSWLVQRANRLDAHQTLEERAAIVAGIVEQRVGRWSEVLHGVRGLFVAAQDISVRGFSDYVRNLNLDSRYPGFLSLQFLRYVRDDELERFEKAVRADPLLTPPGSSAFVVSPPGARDDYFVTLFIEPRKGNEAAFGFDAAFSPERRAAIERTLQRDDVTGSGPLSLAQRPTGVGYILREPVYRDATPPKAPAQRRAALFGMVSVVLVMDDFIDALLPSRTWEHLELKLYDLGWAHEAERAAPAGQLLYDSGLRRPQPRRLEDAPFHVIDVPVAGRLWRFRFHDSSRSESSLQSAAPALVAMAGLLVSGLAFQLVRLSTFDRARLEARVVERTAELSHANELLRAGEQRLELALAGADLGLWDWDIASDELVCNARWLAMRDQDPGSAPQHLTQAAECIHPDDRAAMREALSLHLQGHAAGYSAEYRIRRADGRWRWLLDRGRVVERNADSSPRRVTGTNLDIDDRKHGEEDRVAAETARRLAAAKDEFIARISHELRTPLNAVLGFAQLLTLDPSEPLHPEQRRKVDQIVSAADHLLAVVGDLLDFTSVESGRAPVNVRTVPAEQVVIEALDLVRADADAADVRLITAFSDMPTQVQADPLRLRQVLVNLLSNGIKYNLRGGTVRLIAMRRDDEVAFDVTDTGIGLDDGQLLRLFQPFERLGAQNSTVQGTGLGLALSKRLVDLMGGRMEVASKPGQGSRFTVLLPLGAG